MFSALCVWPFWSQHTAYVVLYMFAYRFICECNFGVKLTRRILWAWYEIASHRLLICVDNY